MQKHVNKEQKIQKIDRRMSSGSANKSSGVPVGVPTTPAASEAAPMEVDPVQLISDGLSAVTEGCRLPVKMAGPGDDWPMAEVLFQGFVGMFQAELGKINFLSNAALE